MAEGNGAGNGGGNGNDPQYLVHSVRQRSSDEIINRNNMGGNSDDLAQQEAAAAEGLYNDSQDANSGNQHRLFPRTSRKKLWLAGGGIVGGIVMMLLVVITLFSLFGNLKNIHFATLLRTVGLARFNYVMQKRFARITFDAAVLTDKSTGSAAKALQGAHPSRQLRQLGTDGTLKFEFSNGVTGKDPMKDAWRKLTGTNNFKGVTINGQAVDLDAISRALHDGKDFNKLSRSQKKSVRVEFAEQVKFGMNDALKSESRSYRLKALDNIRKVSGIKMIKWPDKARMYLGKSPKDARKLNLDDLKQNVDGADSRPKSGLKAIQEGADQARDDAERAVLNGESPGQTRTRWANTLRTTAKVSGAVFVTTVACIVHDLDNSFEASKKETEMRSMRLGHDALTGGSQAMEGDVYAEATNAESTRWDNAEKSVMYKQATGQTKFSKNDQQQLSDIPSIGGPATTFASVIDTVDDVIFPETVGGNIVDAILNAIGVERSLNDVGCDALLNEYVQYSIAGTEIIISIGSAGATGGVIAGLKAAISGALVAAGTIGLGQLLGTLIDKATASYAGLDYGATQSGESLYNQSAVGTNRLSQTADRQVNFGRPMTDDEAKKAQTTAMAEVKRQISEKPFTYRYFAIENPFSLTGKLVAHMPTNFGDLGSSTRDSISSIASIFSTPQRFLSSVGNIFMPTQYAMAEQGANVLKAGDVETWDWTDEEMTRLDTEEKFELDEIDAYFDANSADLKEKFDKCYSGYDLQADKPKECTREYLSTDEAIYYRAHESNMTMATELLEGGVK